MSAPPPQPDASPDRIASGLARLSTVLKQGALRQGSSQQLSPTQQQVLTLVSVRPANSLTLKDIAAHLGLKTPSTSRSVATLVGKQLLSKKTSPIDARAIVFALTPAGRHEAGITTEWPDALLAAIEELAADERAAILRMLIKMIRQLQENGDLPRQRMCVDCDHFHPYAYANPEQPHHCDYVGAPFGDRELRLDCNEQQFAPEHHRQPRWQLFINGQPPKEIA